MKNKILYMRLEHLENDQPFWVAHESDQEIIDGADDGDMIFEAVLTPVGKVKRSVELLRPGEPQKGKKPKPAPSGKA